MTGYCAGFCAALRLVGQLMVNTNTVKASWLHRASNNVENLSLPTDAHNVKKHRVIKTF